MKLNIALVGNPNSGKSSVFNSLTGLNQTVGNFPGVTVDKKVGEFTTARGSEISVIDLPGLYSLYPTSKDEKVVVEILSNPNNELFPDLIVYVADALQMERHILLATQIVDLGIPLLFVSNMTDLALKEGVKVNTKKFSKDLGIEVINVSARTGQNMIELKNLIENKIDHLTPVSTGYEVRKSDRSLAKDIKNVLQEYNFNDYQALLIAHHVEWLRWLSDDQRFRIQKLINEHHFKALDVQVDETMRRFNRFSPIVKVNLQDSEQKINKLTHKIDNIITHRVFGPIIFMAIMFFVFQALFAWASYPMDLIEGIFSWLATQVENLLGDHWYTSLINDGILAGIGGVMIFIPQILMLFLLITVLEEIGYMSRAVFMFDKVLRVFGLNGRSIVSLISSGACAIPAIMATRTIGNWKERITTIMVAPLISCSARIPVYIVLIGFAVPDEPFLGIFNLQGAAFMGLYLLSVISALLSAWVFKIILKSDEPSYLLIELPQYKKPLAKNVFITLRDKVLTFVWEAGKIIFLISIVLWVIASYGPNEEMAQASERAEDIAEMNQMDEQAKDNLEASLKLEASYAGHLGKFIEPIIRPLGFDWKIGIALITSFAAREVFVGTMATIYAVGSDDETSVRERLASEVDPITGEKVYTPAVAMSLLIFYLFAMQCMSTLAITKRETKSWKWPAIQFLYMTGLAYIGSFVVYQLFS